MPRPSSSATPSVLDSEPPPIDEEFIRQTAYIPDTITEVGVEGQQPVEGVTASVVPPELIAQALGPSFQALFRAAASFRGEHWQLQDFEKTALVQGWTPIVQVLLAKLGNSEQVMLTLAMASTAAIVGGKIAQDATKRASSMVSTKTPKSAASSAFSVSAEAVRQPAPNSPFETPEE